jgi:hypothetical protein
MRIGGCVAVYRLIEIESGFAYFESATQNLSLSWRTIPVGCPSTGGETHAGELRSINRDASRTTLLVLIDEFPASQVRFAAPRPLSVVSER